MCMVRAAMVDTSKIRLKKQQHMRSCGQTCVAMIANKSYEQVLTDFKRIYFPKYKKIPSWIFNGKRRLVLGTHSIDLHVMLRKYGIKTNKRITKYTGRDCLPNLSILNVLPRKIVIDGKTYTSGHWVVCVKRGRKFVVYDPLFGENTLRDYRPIRHFIKIHI